MQVLAADFDLSEENMKVLDELHLRKPNRKLVKRQRIDSTLIDESAGRVLEDGYKLKAANNVFPRSVTCPASIDTSSKTRVSAY